MKILSRNRKHAHFKMDLGVEGGFNADNQDMKKTILRLLLICLKKVIFKSKKRTI